MEPTNGNIPKFRVALDMRLVLDSYSYEQVGALMDRVHRAVTRELREIEARFDFTGFQTYPCKAAQMSQLTYPTEAGSPEYSQQLPSLTSGI
jgi:hypothetical protein